jgi:hypothetical protein
MATFFDEKSIHSKKYASNEKEKRKRVSVGDERVFKSIGPPANRWPFWQRGTSALSARTKQAE